MKEELVSLETAKLLKEKGFDEQYNYVYHPEFKVPQKTTVTVTNSHYLNQYKTLPTHHELGKMYVACSQSLAQKWLREKHNIIITSDPIVGFKDCNYSWNIYGKSNIWRILHFTAISYDSYEQALEAGLIEGLKLVKST